MLFIICTAFTFRFVMVYFSTPQKFTTFLTSPLRRQPVPRYSQPHPRPRPERLLPPPAPLPPRTYPLRLGRRASPPTRRVPPPSPRGAGTPRTPLGAPPPGLVHVVLPALPPLPPAPPLLPAAGASWISSSTPSGASARGKICRRRLEVGARLHGGGDGRPGRRATADLLFHAQRRSLHARQDPPPPPRGPRPHRPSDPPPSPPDPRRRPPRRRRPHRLRVPPRPRRRPAGAPGECRQVATGYGRRGSEVATGRAAAGGRSAPISYSASRSLPRSHRHRHPSAPSRFKISQ
ncbi:hypothetical protein U9M48_040497 [Paspalum notatum var. saurae]|uniref:Uncharacterized protein n=1 Tax=Paspalum notatum var. saurae TaxID=547442 RepID=A0AAQ3UNJ0_PASNO